MPLGTEVPPDGRQRSIDCYSGGTAIFRGKNNPNYSIYVGLQDGHVTFVDEKNGRWTRVTGACVISWPIPAQVPPSAKGPRYHGPPSILRD